MANLTEPKPWGLAGTLRLLGQRPVSERLPPSTAFWAAAIIG